MKNKETQPATCYHCGARLPNAATHPDGFCMQTGAWSDQVSDDEFYDDVNVPWWARLR